MDREFEPLLRSYEIDELEAHHGAVYGAWADGSLQYLNRAWFRFAEQNGGEPKISAEWGLGRSMLDAISEERRAEYRSGVDRCLATEEVWRREYDCSSPDVFRRYHQLVYPLGQREGVLVVNSLLIERPFESGERYAHPADIRNYRAADGMTSQCSYCRRIRHIEGDERWDWVPEWTERSPLNTSHGICPTCIGHYHPVPEDS